MQKVIPQRVIGATSAGSGKTTLTLGLIRALSRRGMKIQPFKCGPDYIDTKYHSIAAGCDGFAEAGLSVNLDSFMQSEQHIEVLYNKYGAVSDGCVIEGVMGLYDGYDKMAGSSAQIAGILHIPVLLVVNAKSCAYSVAPLIAGFKNFRKEVEIAGVVFNRVGGESHYSMLKEACESVGVRSFGYIPKDSRIEIPSRHLGLSIDDEFGLSEFIDRLADSIEEHVEIEAILSFYTRPFQCVAVACGVVDSCDGSMCGGVDNCKEIGRQAERRVRISGARDEAFNFTYRENIAVLESLGDVTYFSPMRDDSLLGSDFVYLPGGYPELFLEKLSANTKMRKSIREYVLAGGKMLAECGGMMYLCDTVAGISREGDRGKEYPMCAVLHDKATMEGMRLHIGYRRFVYNGIEVRGHEFHYSNLETNDAEDSVVAVYNASGGITGTKLLRYNNLIAGYTHLYWGEFNPLNLY